MVDLQGAAVDVGRARVGVDDERASADLGQGARPAQGTAKGRGARSDVDGQVAGDADVDARGAREGVMVDLQGAAVDVGRARVGARVLQDEGLVADLSQTAVAGDDATEGQDLRVGRDRRKGVRARGGAGEGVAQRDRGGPADDASGGDGGGGAQRDAARADRGDGGASRDARTGDGHADEEAGRVRERHRGAGGGLRGLRRRSSVDGGDGGGGADARAGDGLADREAEGILDDEGRARASDRRERRRFTQGRPEEADGVRLRHAGDCGGTRVGLEEVGRIGVRRDAGEVRQGVVQLRDLRVGLADGQGRAVDQGDGRAGLAEERADGLVGRRGEGRAVQEHQTGAVDDAVGRGRGKRAGLDDGGAVIAAQAGQGHGAVAALEEVAGARDLTRIGGVRGLVDGDGTAAEFDARIGVARQVVDGLGRVVEADRGLAAAGAGVEHDVRGVDEGVVLAVRERQGDAVLDDHLAVEVLLLVVDVDDAELAVANVRRDTARVGAGRNRADDEVLRGHGQGRADRAVDLRPEGARVVLDDAERAGGADDDAAIAEALHVRDDLARGDVDLTHGGALPHQGERAGAVLHELAEATVDAAGEVAVMVGVLQDGQGSARGDVDDGARAGAGDPHVGRDFAPEGLEVADRLVGRDAELRGRAARQVTRTPLGRAAGIRSSIRAGQARMEAVRTDEVDGGGQAQGEVVGVGQDEVTAADEDVAGSTAGVQDGEGPAAGLVDAASAIEATDRTDDAVVDVDVDDVIGVLAHIEDRVHVRAVVAGEEVRQRAGIEVVDVVEAEEERAGRVGELVVAEGRTCAHDVISRALEAEGRRALEEDGAGAGHARREARRVSHAVVGPLVEVTRHLQGALVDEYDAREGGLRPQVVRQHRGGRRGNLEGVVREVVEVAEGIVLQRGAAGLDQGRQRRKKARVHGDVVARAEELRGRGRIDELVDGQGRPRTDVERSHGLEPLLEGGRLGEQARRAEVRRRDRRAGQDDVGIGDGQVLDGDVSAGRRQGADEGGRGEDEELAGEFHDEARCGDGR